MTAAWLILSVLTALACYLASPHQRLCPRVQPRHRLLRFAAGAGAILATAIAVVELGWWPGVFAALTAQMLALVLLPYVDAWRSGRSAR